VGLLEELLRLSHGDPGEPIHDGLEVLRADGDAEASLVEVAQRTGDDVPEFCTVGRLQAPRVGGGVQLGRRSDVGTGEDDGPSIDPRCGLLEGANDDRVSELRVGVGEDVHGGFGPGRDELECRRDRSRAIHRLQPVARQSPGDRPQPDVLVGSPGGRAHDSQEALFVVDRGNEQCVTRLEEDLEVGDVVHVSIMIGRSSIAHDPIGISARRGGRPAGPG